MAAEGSDVGRSSPSPEEVVKLLELLSAFVLLCVCAFVLFVCSSFGGELGEFYQGFAGSVKSFGALLVGVKSGKSH